MFLIVFLPSAISEKELICENIIIEDKTLNPAQRIGRSLLISLGYYLSGKVGGFLLLPPTLATRLGYAFGIFWHWFIYKP